ncbi:hypothetical protein CA13_44360 [Planctomycetes bacterium CA13]|uniref:STAS domain-containing protein n=1 Tax=Novipirellula herctigrandis TaxID=2527986 RepID=A0A5C5Z8W0_9BACT|nr:hypothetical protein CA13_44360 [Planctomycetes bacterium CA13]
MTYDHIQTSLKENVPVVTLAVSKFIDRLLIQETQQELISYIKSTKPEKMVIDFKSVESISSEFITTMLRCSEYVRSENGKLALCGMSPVVRMAFKVTNLDGTILSIQDSVVKAIDSFES